MSYPAQRPRRLRGRPVIRDWVAETRLSADSLVQPLFVRPGKGEEVPIESLPDQFQYSADRAALRARVLFESGVKSLLLFGIPSRKDASGSESTDPRGVVPSAIRQIKSAVPEMNVIADVCLCEYTDHGHCGVLSDRDDESIDNDATIEILAKQATILADVGADVIAPSAMADGQVMAIREGLDEHSHREVPILAYSAKFASAFYGPFRDAAENTPSFGDRKGYQMDPRNFRESLREVALDIEEGADIVMVKPALPYLDVIARVRDQFDVPVAAYHVSGEFSMIEAAAERDWLDGREALLESLTSIHRAGASVIITYAASRIARDL